MTFRTGADGQTYGFRSDLPIDDECPECRAWPPTLHSSKCSRYGVDPDREKHGVCWHGVFTGTHCEVCDD